MKTCLKCEVNYSDDAEFCPICKSTLAPLSESEVKTTSAPQTTPTAEKKHSIANIIIFVAHVAVAIAIFILFFKAANSIKIGGLYIGNIQSVGGKTLEEAYYQNLSYIYEGYYMFTIGFGAFCSTVITSLGIKRFKK